jgi:uncharacterized protein
MKSRDFLALALLVPLPTLGAAAGLFWWPGTLLGQGIFLFSKVGLLLIPIFWQRLIDRRPLRWPQLRGKGLGHAVMWGLSLGALVLLVFFAMRSANAIDSAALVDRAQKSGLSDKTFYVALALYWIFCNSLLEEYVWRGFVFEKFKGLLPAPWAMMASSLAFTLHHVVALSAQVDSILVILGSVGVFVAGLLFAWIYDRNRAILPAYICHALLDIPVFIMGYILIFA